MKKAILGVVAMLAILFVCLTDCYASKCSVLQKSTISCSAEGRIISVCDSMIILEELSGNKLYIPNISNLDEHRRNAERFSRGKTFVGIGWVEDMGVRTIKYLSSLPID